MNRNARLVRLDEIRKRAAARSIREAIVKYVRAVKFKYLLQVFHDVLWEGYRIHGKYVYQRMLNKKDVIDRQQVLGSLVRSWVFVIRHAVRNGNNNEADRIDPNSIRQEHGVEMLVALQPFVMFIQYNTEEMDVVGHDLFYCRIWELSGDGLDFFRKIRTANKFPASFNPAGLDHDNYEVLITSAGVPPYGIGVHFRNPELGQIADAVMDTWRGMRPQEPEPQQRNKRRKIARKRGTPASRQRTSRTLSSMLGQVLGRQREKQLRDLWVKNPRRK